MEVEGENVGIDFISELLQRNMELVVELLISHLDFASLRRALWVCRRWRSFVQSNCKRLEFDEKEREANVLENGNHLILTLEVPQAFSDVERDVQRIRKAAKSVEDLVPLRLPFPCPNIYRPNKKLFNQNYILVRTKRNFIRICRQTGKTTWFKHPKLHKEHVSKCATRSGIHNHWRMHRDYLCQYEQNKLTVYKMNTDATDINLFHDFCFFGHYLHYARFWTLAPSGTEYLILVRYSRNQDKFAVHITNMDEKETHTIIEKGTLAFFDDCVIGDEFVAMVFSMADFEKFMMLHVYDLSLKESSKRVFILDREASFYEYLRLANVCYNGNKIAVVCSNDSEAECYVIDILKDEQGPMTKLQLDPDYKYLHSISFAGEKHLVTCLRRIGIDLRLKNAVRFVIWEMSNSHDSFTALWSVDFSDLGLTTRPLGKFGTPEEEFWLLAQYNDDPKERKTKLIVFGLNKSLMLMDSFSRA